MKLNILTKKYPDILKKDILSEDLIFFCRNGLKENNSEVEEELLFLIKSKNWSWYSRDIDSNIILTYPVFHGAKKIVSYLIESGKYNIKEYNPTLSKALCASISLKGEQMLDYLLTQEMNKKYIDDLIIKSFIFASKVDDEDYKNLYLSFSNKIIQSCDFDNTMKGIIYYVNPIIFNYFLLNHPLSNKEKITHTNKFLNEYEHFGMKFKSVADKIEIIKRLEVFTCLEEMPINKKNNKINKV